MRRHCHRFVTQGLEVQTPNPVEAGNGSSPSGERFVFFGPDPALFGRDRAPPAALRSVRSTHLPRAIRREQTNRRFVLSCFFA